MSGACAHFIRRFTERVPECGKPESFKKQLWNDLNKAICDRNWDYIKYVSKAVGKRQIYMFRAPDVSVPLYALWCTKSKVVVTVLRGGMRVHVVKKKKGPRKILPSEFPKYLEAV